LLFALVLTSCLLFSGILFGWAPLVLMLKREGFFASLCEPDESTCAAQDNRLNLIYTLGATTTTLVGFPAGLLLDAVGPIVTTALAAVVEVAGLIIIALSDADGEVPSRSRTEALAVQPKLLTSPPVRR
jgi:LAT3 family solute carrier family 43 protein 3